MVKQESKKPFEQQITDWIIANRKLVFTVPLIIAGAALAYVGFSHVQAEGEKKAQGALFKVDTAFEKKTEELLNVEEEKAEKMAASTKSNKKDQIPDPVELPKTPEFFKSTYQSEISAYENVMNEYPGTLAASMAAIRLAGHYRDHKDLESAKAVLDRISDTALNDRNVFYGMLHGLKAAVLTDMGKCEEALTHYEKILVSQNQAAMHPQALLRQGLCYMDLKKWDQADGAFDKIEKDHKQSSAAFSAKNFKRLVALKKGAQ